MPAMVLEQPRHGNPCRNYRLFIKHLDIAVGEGRGGEQSSAGCSCGLRHGLPEIPTPPLAAQGS
ncbi:uncharacterized protein LY79DRAFT_564963 [Colletotrichum navitas]|uniref:Uncharacterized protein n=1 Tax=Colletotrichum navitas TaxID=681940 RepID=A0AAD8PR98_9PEZI|nr:uncharacterized protein LY79DRAFT_564963 [Colletotrichum navitas]KAK1579176.1 hypothetical protein LY79DRAFT_564963 [Colletotrichum navitas]